MNAAAVLLAVLLAVLPVALNPGFTRKRDHVALHLGWDGVTRQTLRSSCGPALVAALASRAGRNVSEHDVVARARLQADGVTLAELARLLHLYGFAGDWFRLTGRQLSRVSGRFVAHTSQDGGHFVLVEAVRQDHVIVSDPARGRRAVALAAFLRDWTGNAFIFSGSPPD
jgi:ABC-type bacteriocin/lantibiotic exporter with double-glycine peptidase domain